MHIQATPEVIINPYRYSGGGGGGSSTLLTGLEHWWDLGGDVNADAGGVDFTDSGSTTGTGDAPDGGDCRVLTNDRLTIAAGSVMASGSAVTVACWIKQTGATNDIWWINRFSSSSFNGVTYQGASGNLVRNYWNTVFSQFTPSTTTVGNWRCVVFTGDGSGGEIFFDGVSEDTTSGTPLFGSAPFEVGVNILGAAAGNFRICSMAIWDRVLTSGEIAEFYNSGTNLRYADL